MSFDDIRWARDVTGLDEPMPRFLLLLIATYTGAGPSANSRPGRRHDRPVCFALRSTLARQMGVSTRMLDRHISTLKTAGLIRSVQVGRGPAEITLLRHSGGEANEALVRQLGGEPEADLGSPSEISWVRQRDGEHKALKAHSTPPTPSEQPINRAGDDGVSCEPANITPAVSPAQKVNDAGSASPGSPSRLNGGSPAPPSELVGQSASEPETSGPRDQSAFLQQRIGQDSGHNAPPPLPINRKPILPPIVDRELYDRLTLRSARGSAAENSVLDISPNQQSGRGPKR